MTILPSDILEAEHDYTREVKMPFPVSGIKTTALKFNVCVCVCVCVSLFSVLIKKKKKKKKKKICPEENVWFLYCRVRIITVAGENKTNAYK